MLSFAQDDRGVTVRHGDPKAGGLARVATADRCVCTIPLSILSQIDVQASSAMQEAINAVPCESSVKVELPFKRRLREHANLLPEHLRNRAALQNSAPPETKRGPGRPRKEAAAPLTG